MRYDSLKVCVLAPSSFLLLVVRHLFLEAMRVFLVASFRSAKSPVRSVASFRAVLALHRGVGPVGPRSERARRGNGWQRVDQKDDSRRMRDIYIYTYIYIHIPSYSIIFHHILRFFQPSITSVKSS